MEAFSGEEHQTIVIKMENVPEYKVEVKLSTETPGADQMTVLLFAIDLVKERTGIANMENKEVALYFDPENPTTAEEVLNTKMEEMLIKRKGTINPFLD